MGQALTRVRSRGTVPSWRQPVSVTTNGNAKLQPDVPFNLTIPGVAPHPSAAPAVAVPADTLGVLCTITVVETVGYGYIKAYPAGINPAPNTSVINWSATGQILATTTIVVVR